MAVNLSQGLRTAIIQAVEDEGNGAGTPTLRIYSGSKPAACNSAETGTKLAEMSLPSNWLTPVSPGVAVMAGTWQDSSSDASGTAGYFRIYTGTSLLECILQGTITATGGGGDMTLSSTTITAGNPFNITSFTITAGNA